MNEVILNAVQKLGRKVGSTVVEMPIAAGEVLAAGDLAASYNNQAYGIKPFLVHAESSLFNSGNYKGGAYCALDDNRILFVYSDPPNSDRLAARIVTIGADGKHTNIGNAVLHPTETISQTNALNSMITLLSPTKAIFVWKNGNARTAAIVVDVTAANAITFGTAKHDIDLTHTAQYFSIATIDANRAYLAVSGNRNSDGFKTVYHAVLVVDGMTITCPTGLVAIQWSNQGTGLHFIHCCYQPVTKSAVLVYTLVDYQPPRIFSHVIGDANTITYKNHIGDLSTFNSSGPVGYDFVVPLPDGRVVVVFTDGTYGVKACTITFDGTVKMVKNQVVSIASSGGVYAVGLLFSDQVGVLLNDGKYVFLRVTVDNSIKIGKTIPSLLLLTASLGKIIRMGRVQIVANQNSNNLYYRPTYLSPADGFGSGWLGIVESVSGGVAKLVADGSANVQKSLIVGEMYTQGDFVPKSIDESKTVGMAIGANRIKITSPYWAR